MNERIEKFARESGAWHQVYDQKRFMHDHNFDIEKFAQLIVRECIDTAFHKGHPDLEFLLKHFGVK